MQPRPPGTALVRTSKYKHIFGTPFQTVECIGGLKVGAAQTDSTVLKVSSKFAALPWNISGAIGVVPLSLKGAISSEFPLILSEDNTINDLCFSPFDDCLLATAGNDGIAALWKIPEEGLTNNLTTPMISIPTTDKRLLSVEFHPLASNVMICLDAGKQIKFFDIEKNGEQLSLPDNHKGLIANISWNYDGSLMATSSKDKSIRIFDPRANRMIAETQSHQGAKAGRVLWTGKRDLIFTVGFGKGSEREYALYDPRKIDQRLILTQIDSGTSTLFPFYEPDNGIILLAGKGDGNIRYYELTNENPYVHYLSEFKSKDPQCGLTVFPKSMNDVKKCEIIRIGKLTPNGLLVPIKFEIPRAENQFFQEDIFPDTFDGKPSMTSEQWFMGENISPGLISQNRL